MTEELQELEPLDEQPKPAPAGRGAAPAGAPMAVAAGGSPVLGAPAYNPAAGKEYFRFLFAGVFLFIGCMMPWGPHATESVGYHSVGGAISLFIAIGLIWTWWGSIAFNRFRGGALLWVVAALIPLFAQVLELMNRPGEIQVPAIEVNEETGTKTLTGEFTEKGDYGIGDFFGDYMDFQTQVSQVRAQEFLRQFGAGRLVVFLGALWAEIAMLMAIMGGAKEAKNQKKAAVASRSAKTGGDAGGSAKGGARKRRK